MATRELKSISISIYFVCTKRPINLFGARYVFEHGLKVIVSCRAHRSDVLGDKPTFNELGDGHLRVARRKIRSQLRAINAVMPLLLAPFPSRWDGIGREPLGKFGITS
jgi:hypothetical protein